MAKTEYHVLREIEVPSEEDTPAIRTAFEIVGTYDANGDDHARRMHLIAKPDDVEYALVATPSRSWKAKKAKLRPRDPVFEFDA